MGCRFGAVLALDGRGALAGGGGAEGRLGREEVVARIVVDDNDDCGGGGGGKGFDRSAVTVRGAADRDCLTDCGKGGTGGRGRGGTGGASALFDEGGARVGSKVIDRDLRSVNDSLRRREPADVGEVTDGAGDGDGDLVGPGGGNANLDCEGGFTVSCARRGVISFGGGGP